MYGMSQGYCSSGMKREYSGRDNSGLESRAHSEIYPSPIEIKPYALTTTLSLAYHPSNQMSLLSSYHSFSTFLPELRKYSASSVLKAYTPALNNEYLFTPLQPEYHFQPHSFLKPGKEGKFVGEAEEVREFIEEVFEKVYAAPFPEDIKVSVLNKEQFRKLTTNSATIGLSINRRKQGLWSEIFVLNDSVARVMLTIGHELGHVLTETLSNPHDEEAKAYAFSFLWMKVIKENNIAGLGDAIITERPAENGLHNRAFFFVEALLRKGKKAGDIYRWLVDKTMTITM